MLAGSRWAQDGPDGPGGTGSAAGLAAAGYAGLLLLYLLFTIPFLRRLVPAQTETVVEHGPGGQSPGSS